MFCLYSIKYPARISFRFCFFHYSFSKMFILLSIFINIIYYFMNIFFIFAISSMRTMKYDLSFISPSNSLLIPLSIFPSQFNVLKKHLLNPVNAAPIAWACGCPLEYVNSINSQDLTFSFFKISFLTCVRTVYARVPVEAGRGQVPNGVHGST